MSNRYLTVKLAHNLRALLSFPTRRSSDLEPRQGRGLAADQLVPTTPDRRSTTLAPGRGLTPGRARVILDLSRIRSEEHTSELQSRRELVCRLLLEKKNAKEQVLLVCHLQH